jgi:hypothetical protein
VKRDVTDANEQPREEEPGECDERHGTNDTAAAARTRAL